MSSGNERAVSPNSLREGGDTIALEAFRNAERVDNFLRTTFQRNGWDGKGGALEVVVHVPDEGGAKLNNAYWDNDRGRIYFGDGDGRVFAPLAGSLDVMAHETAHAIVDSEVKLRYSGQQGAINESFGDIIGSLADPDDWLIGEDVFTPGVPNDAIRDLAKPRFSHTNQIPPGTDPGVHDLSGIPSLAAVRVAEKVGRNDMGQIWYRALTDHLDSRAGYSGAARATMSAAHELFGSDSAQFAAVRDAWKSVGVDSRFRLATAVGKVS
jgi:Zn-dependent metalloprotease